LQRWTAHLLPSQGTAEAERRRILAIALADNQGALCAALLQEKRSGKSPARIGKMSRPTTAWMVVSVSSDRHVGHGLQGQVVVGREARIVASEAAALRSSDLPDDGGISSILPTPSFARRLQVQKPLVRKIEIRQANQG
jgi:hypothetical protein